MRYKIGDVAWNRDLRCKCVIEEVHVETYLISYIRYNTVRFQKVVPSDLTDYLIHCPICGKNLRVINGLLDLHPKDDIFCYGSYLPINRLII